MYTAYVKFLVEYLKYCVGFVGPAVLRAFLRFASLSSRRKRQCTVFDCRRSNLKDEMSLKSRGPIPLYYEVLYGI